MNSILTSIKKLLGIEEDYTAFDTDIIIYINSILSVLNQVGIGVKGFKIADKSATWDSFLTEGSDFEAIKSYVYIRVKLLFDPPSASNLVDNLNKMASEFEWRAFVYADPHFPEETIEPAP